MIKVLLSNMLGAKKMTMSELSRRSGASRMTIQNLYHEQVGGIQWDVLSKICAALDCQPGDLLEYIPDKPTVKEKAVQN